MNKEEQKVTLQEMFREYAKNELEMIKNSDPNKLYHRILPNVTDKNKATIDFLYKKIIIGGSIFKDTIVLNKLKVTKEGREEDIEEAIAKITETVNKGDMKLINELK